MHSRPQAGERWAVDELDRVLYGDTIATYNRTRQPGGEWDVLRSTPLRVRQRITGAGYMSLHGMMPDVAAERIAREVPGVDTVDQAMTWFVRTACEAIRQRRRIRHWDRHQRHAQAMGARTYHEWRTTFCVALGHASLWQYRKAKGWAENRVEKGNYWRRSA